VRATAERHDGRVLEQDDRVRDRSLRYGTCERALQLPRLVVRNPAELHNVSAARHRLSVVHAWTAAEHVDEERAARLIRAQFLPLPERSVELVSEGWDYVVHRVDERWAFRFPRREVVVAGTERELACLPAIAELVPVGIPAPVFVGVPGDGYPWPFYGAVSLPGREATSADADAIARPLARALRALHACELDCDLPADPLGRVDMAVRVPRTRD